MRSDNYVIVKASKLYRNDDRGIIINDSIETVSSINREVEVVTYPEGVSLKQGDLLIVHHNILRKKYDIKGNIINSNFWIKDDLYYVPLTEIFMIKRGDIWRAFTPFVFVKPIIQEVNILSFDQTRSTEHTGVIKYSNEDLINNNIKEGDVVGFNKNSEYQFNIDGEILYKMTTPDILLKIKC